MAILNYAVCSHLSSMPPVSRTCYAPSQPFRDSPISSVGWHRPHPWPPAGIPKLSRPGQRRTRKAADGEDLALAGLAGESGSGRLLTGVSVLTLVHDRDISMQRTRLKHLTTWPPILESQLLRPPRAIPITMEIYTPERYPRDQEYLGVGGLGLVI